jgi:4-amino-4-deoxychorismate lyase
MAGSLVESALRDRSDWSDLKLIETLGWDGQAFARLDRHLARLAASAALLDWGCDLRAVRAAMAASVGDSAARVRVTLDAFGTIEVTAGALPDPLPVWRVGLSTVRLFSGDPWLQVKTTHRPAYEAARAEMPEGLNEVILLNERGEVCDGTITTVFFDRGEGRCTPPLSAGLLPGVLRAEMLARGEVREETLLAEDLGHVRLWLGNSLRGLGNAEWVEDAGVS